MSKAGKVYFILVCTIWLGGITFILAKSLFFSYDNVLFLGPCIFCLAMLVFGVLDIKKFWKTTITTIWISKDTISFKTLDGHIHEYEKTDILSVKKRKRGDEDYTFRFSDGSKLFTYRFLVYLHVYFGAADCSDRVDLDFFNNFVCKKDI